MKLTKLQDLVLRQAIADGGEVELGGLDAHPGWTKRHVNAADKLADLGLGTCTSRLTAASRSYAVFAINEAGKRAVSANEGQDNG